MGMYNEVFATCPRCHRRRGGYLQVRQYVLGFGEFDLSNPDTLRELSGEQLQELRDEVRREGMSCRWSPTAEVENHFMGDGGRVPPCGHRFNPVTGEGYESHEVNLWRERARQLFPHAE